MYHARVCNVGAIAEGQRLQVWQIELCQFGQSTIGDLRIFNSVAVVEIERPQLPQPRQLLDVGVCQTPRTNGHGRFRKLLDLSLVLDHMRRLTARIWRERDVEPPTAAIEQGDDHE